VYALTCAVPWARFRNVLTLNLPYPPPPGRLLPCVNAPRVVPPPPVFKHNQPRMSLHNHYRVPAC